MQRNPFTTYIFITHFKSLFYSFLSLELNWSKETLRIHQIEGKRKGNFNNRALNTYIHVSNPFQNLAPSLGVAEKERKKERKKRRKERKKEKALTCRYATTRANIKPQQSFLKNNPLPEIEAQKIKWDISVILYPKLALYI